MTDFVPGGRRRIDRVLAPDFVEGLAELDLDTVRARRGQADQEEADLSFARRLLQGRLDLLRAEEARRQRGEGPLTTRPRSDDEIVAALKEILADETREDFGSGRHPGAEPSRVGEHRREAERAVADVVGSDLEMTDETLADAIVRLSEIETRVSRARRKVQAVMDTLTEEITRRYQHGDVPFADLS
jgi:hypothetical protein